MEGDSDIAIAIAISMAMAMWATTTTTSMTRATATEVGTTMAMGIIKVDSLLKMKQPLSAPIDVKAS